MMLDEGEAVAPENLFRINQKITPRDIRIAG